MTGDSPCTHILIPYDGSPSAQNALELAALLARQRAAQVRQVTILRAIGSGYLARHVHNVDLRVLKLEQTREWQRLRQRHLDEEVLPTLELARQFLEIKGVTAPIATQVAEGKVAEVILRTAAQAGVTTICMGRRGLSPFKEFFLGSVTRAVLGAAREVGVYIAGRPRTPEADLTLFPALIAVDGSAMSLRAVREAALLAGEGGAAPAPLTLLHVVDLDLVSYDLADDLMGHMAAGQKVLEEAGKLLADAGVAYEEKLLSGNPARVIAQLAEEDGFATVFLGHKGLSPLAHLILGSVASNVLHRVEHPTVALIYG